MLLQYKTVMMTGGASGIGRATVLMLAKAGARVLLCDINQAGAEETIKLSNGAAVDYIKLDLTQDTSVETCAKQALQLAGNKIDVFVNAAGWDRTQPFVNADQAFIDKVLGINLVGPLRLTRALFPAMIEGGGGKIVFVSSDAGRVGSLGETPYAAAKGGISDSPSRWLARGPGTGLRSTASVPALPIRRCSMPTRSACARPCSGPSHSVGSPPPRTSPGPSSTSPAPAVITSPARS